MVSSRAKKENATKLNRQEGLILLGTFELTSSASRNMLISNVKQMYEKGNIRTMKEAEGLIKLVQENKLDEFDTRFGKIEKTENAKVAKRKAEEIVKDADYITHEKESPTTSPKSKTEPVSYQRSRLKLKRSILALRLHGKTGWQNLLI